MMLGKSSSDQYYQKLVLVLRVRMLAQLLQADSDSSDSEKRKKDKKAEALYSLWSS